MGIGSIAGMSGSPQASGQMQAAEMMYKMENKKLATDYQGQVEGFRGDYNQAQQASLDSFEQYYGGIEENLSNYYKNLNPVKFAQQYKTSLADYTNKQLQQHTDSMASRGLMTSGMREQASKEAAFGLAQGNAQADLQAEEQVRSMQQGWANRGRDVMANDQQLAGTQAGMNSKLLGLGTQAVMGANTDIANTIGDIRGEKLAGDKAAHANKVKGWDAIETTAGEYSGATMANDAFQGMMGGTSSSQQGKSATTGGGSGGLMKMASA